MSGLQEQSEDMETEDSLIDIHMGSANGDFDKDDIILKAVQNRIGKNFYHPFKILIGLVTYRAGKMPFLAPLAKGQRAIVRALCLSCVRLSICLSVHACVHP